MEKIQYEGRIYTRPDNHERDLYRKKTTKAIRDGKITPMPCEICNDTQVHGHHEVYSNYLNVRWLCPIHHKKIHSIFNYIDGEESYREKILSRIKPDPNDIKAIEANRIAWMLSDKKIQAINEAYGVKEAKLKEMEGR